MRAVAAYFAALFAFSASAYEADALVSSSKGDLPLILTVPHDGGEGVGMTAARTQGATVRDAGTREIAERVARIVEQRTGKRPYLVVAGFSRRYVDANRPESEAVESEAALPAYRAYHERVAGYVADARRRFPSGALLLDVHGQSDARDTTFRGTRSGLTARRLVEAHGAEALQGAKSITGRLAARGYRVEPPPESASLAEDRRFNGGYTVAAYGSHQPGGIDAIQLELGRAHRDNPRLAQDLAEAILGFMESYGLGAP